MDAVTIENPRTISGEELVKSADRIFDIARKQGEQIGIFRSMALWMLSTSAIYYTNEESLNVFAGISRDDLDLVIPTNRDFTDALNQMIDQSGSTMHLVNPVAESDTSKDNIQSVLFGVIELAIGNQRVTVDLMSGYSEFDGEGNQILLIDPRLEKNLVDPIMPLFVIVNFNGSKYNVVHPSILAKSYQLQAEWLEAYKPDEVEKISKAKGRAALANEYLNKWNKAELVAQITKVQLRLPEECQEELVRVIRSLQGAVDEPDVNAMDEESLFVRQLHFPEKMDRYLVLAMSSVYEDLLARSPDNNGSEEIVNQVDMKQRLEMMIAEVKRLDEEHNRSLHENA